MEKIFYQDGDKWKHNLIPIEFSKNESEKGIDLLIYKNQNALVKRLHVFLGYHNKVLYVDAASFQIQMKMLY